MPEKLIVRVREEIAFLDRLFQEYEELLDKSQRAAPDKVGKAALATILHSFYTGLENIFSTIAREVDGRLSLHSWASGNCRPSVQDNPEIHE